MLSSIRGALSSFRAAGPSSMASAVASSSRVTLPSLPSPPFGQQVRFRSQLAPRRTKHRKSVKGRPAVSTEAVVCIARAQRFLQL
jgi:hypothetical protein